MNSLWWLLSAIILLCVGGMMIAVEFALGGLFLIACGLVTFLCGAVINRKEHPGRRR